MAEVHVSPQESQQETPEQQGTPANNAAYVPSQDPVTRGVPGGVQANQNQPENPQHTAVTRDPASTPSYFRLVLPLLAGRYLWRGVLSTLQQQQSDFFNVFKKTKDSIGGAIEEYEKAVINKQESIKNPQSKENVELTDKLREAGWTKKNAQTELKKFRDNIEKKENFELAGATKKQLVEFSDAQDGIRKFKSDAKKAAVVRKYESAFDGGIGLASTWVTLNYMMRVKSDMHNVFAETVAMEKGVDPRSIKSRDLQNSDNLIVQTTQKNAFRNNLYRFANDALFFVRPVSFAFKKPMVWTRSWYTGEMAIGLKGFYLLKEVMRKETTMFDDLIQLIDRKLNPIKGIGDPISKSEVIDLYQKFASIHMPEAMFNDATIQQNKDGINWEKSYAVFSRITELMNNTYKYKHTVKETDDNDNFALPKFLYLLGHKLINPYKPEETLVYVEVANKYGIEPVKQIRAALSHGATLESAMERYPVSLEALKPKKPVKAVSSEMPAPVLSAKESSAPEPANEFQKPATKVSVAALAHEAPAQIHPVLTQG